MSRNRLLAVDTATREVLWPGDVRGEQVVECDGRNGDGGNAIWYNLLLHFSLRSLGTRDLVRGLHLFMRSVLVVFRSDYVHGRPIARGADLGQNRMVGRGTNSGSRHRIFELITAVQLAFLGD
jgi:hypothetical protein